MFKAYLAASAVAVITTATFGQSVTDFVDYKGGTYTQSFDSLPNPGAISVNTAQVVAINSITYSLPSASGVEFALDDSTLGSGSTSLGGSALAGWYGADSLLDRFGATFGDQTTGGLLDFGPASSSNRTLGLISTSSSGSAYLGVAIKNDTGAPITAINLGFLGELWKQGTFQKTFAYGYYVDNSASSNLIAAATAPTAIMLGTLTTAPTSVGAVDGTNATNQTPVALNNITLNTALQAGGILWITAQIADATGSGQGYGIDNFKFSAVGAAGITTQPASQTVGAGANVTLSVAAGGATAYQWQLNGVNIAGATSSTLTLANIGTTQAGAYTVMVTAGGSTLTSNAATVTVNSNAHPANLSASGFVGTGASVLTGGIVVSGTTSETLLIRGIGPSLALFGVSNPLATPILTVYDVGQKVLGTNTGWGSTAALTAAFTQVGAFTLPVGSADSALVITLPPGAYTAVVSGANGATGMALVEIYDVP